MEVSIELQKELIDALIAFSRDKPFWESPVAIGLLTALTAIATSLLGRWQAFRLQERQSEIEKQLRTHELQMEALKSLSVIEHSVMPRSEPIQGADEYEWLNPIVHKLSAVLDELDGYLKNYGYVSPSCVIDHIHSAINIANQHKWGVSENLEHYDPTDEEINGVKSLIEELAVAVKKFKASIGIPGA